LYRLAPLLGAIALLVGGCGGQAAHRSQTGFTPSASVQPFNGDVSPGDSRAHAEAIVKHQRETHCGERLLDVRCEERATSWTCRWHVEGGAGFTLIKKHALGGIPVHCP